MEFKDEVTISRDRLCTILVFVMNEIIKAQNLDDSYMNFAADIYAEAFEYIFGECELPDGFEEKLNGVKNTIEDCIWNEIIS